MPVRKVSNRGGNTIGKFPSIKMGRMIAYESLIEKDYVILLDYEHDVTWFEEQPLAINYKHENKKHRYTPDFKVLRNGQWWLIECKPEKFVDNEENQRKFEVAQRWCNDKGWRFQVVTDHELRQGFRLQNIKFLTSYARHSIPPRVRVTVCEVLRAVAKPISLRDVCQQLPSVEPSVIVSALLHMAYHGVVHIPLESAEISVHSPVRLTE